MWRSLIVLAIVVGGCGDDGAVVRVDAARADAFVWPPGSYRLLEFGVTNQEDASRTVLEARVGGAAPGSPAYCLPLRTVGGCDIEECVDYTTTAGPNPGEIRFVGDLQSALFSPDARGQYTSTVTTGLLFTPGATVQITATGADMPGFSQSLVAPVPITNASGSVTFTRGMPYVVAWSGGTGAVRVVIDGFPGGIPAMRRTLKCQFDATAQSGTVPPEATRELPIGEGIVHVGSTALMPLTVGTEEVRVYVRSVLRAFTVGIE